MRDDRVLPETRALGVFIVPFLLVAFPLDGRWSAIRITLESQLIGLALIQLATVRAWEQFDKSNALTYVFAGGIALLLFGLATLWSSMVLPRAHAPVGGGDPAVA